VGAEIAQNFDAGDLQQAVKDGLRLLMDGRLIWQGEIVPGSPLRFERSDAWGTSAESPGGMEKGTVLKIQLEHPELGRIELRALGLGGQVNIRLFGSEPAISMMLGALPKMNDRLKQVGLSGTQISVESH
jgi:flagellar hook-length control protein FliK